MHGETDAVEGAEDDEILATVDKATADHEETAREHAGDGDGAVAENISERAGDEQRGGGGETGDRGRPEGEGGGEGEVGRQLRQRDDDEPVCAAGGQVDSRELESDGRLL